MIPKVIHYCWFGGKPLPAEAIKCINSWKTHCPDYVIKEWNESNFDFSICDYAKEAYEARKWAFVSDYARFYILYHEGGIYFDTDVEIIKSIDSLLKEGSFMGFEDENKVNPGLGLATYRMNPIYGEILEFYQNAHFVREDGAFNLTTIVDYTTNILIKHGLKNGTGPQKIGDITIYPKDYFNPMDMDSGKIHITPNTISIHHYAATWVDDYSRFRGKVYQKITSMFGKHVAEKIRKVLGRK